jgi:hypothetical protein
LDSSAKEIEVRPITSAAARALVARLHYSGKSTQNSQLHFGVFLHGRCLGAMQFGPPMDRRKLLPLVEGTGWNGMMELNRMAFSDALPRNSESRALAVAFRLMRKAYPHLEWIVSFADGTQCGDGTIYRAAGFVLTQIRRNTQLLKLIDGSIVARKTLDNPNHTAPDGRFGSAVARERGAVALDGYQLRYIYFLNCAARARLTVPVLPYSAIAAAGAGMYRGQKRVGSADSGTGGDQPSGDGASPISTLQITAASPEG